MDRLTDKRTSRRKRLGTPAATCVQRRWDEAPGPEDAAEESTQQTEATLFALALAVEQRDHQTAGHCERLAFMSVAMGMALHLSRVQLLSLFRGGFLHDVGKVGIPDSILFKPGKLSASEWVVMRSHVVRGEEICRHLKPLSPVLPIIRHHHERWDGTGYPDGLRGNQIPLLARIVQVADIYDALTSPRAYKPAFTPEKALRLIEEETTKGWRDPEIVDLFFRIHKDMIARLGYVAVGADPNLLALRNSISDLQTLLNVAE